MKNVLKKMIFVWAVSFIYAFSLSAQVNVTGVVVDDAGETMPGVNVTLKGIATGTVTDMDGKYSISVPDATTVLVYSFVGYTPQEITVGDRTTINVTLAESTTEIDEVVVVGYGTVRKVNLTGAVAAIDGDDIASRPSTDVLSAIQGQLPGLTVLRTSGQPGKETSGLRIRGFSSANEADALILIDGVEGSLTLLNPEDIESVSVLKDAAAASIYGSRAAAGVVLVTTKKGIAAAEKVKVTYSGSFGINVPGSMPHRISPWEEQDMINIGRMADRGLVEQNPEVSSWVGNPNYNYYPNGTRWTQHGVTNWLEAGVKNFTTQQNHGITLSGGSGKTTYFLSGGYFTKSGLLKYGPDDHNRYNLRATLNSELNNYLQMNVRVSYESTLRSEASLGAGSILANLYNSRGRQAIYLPEEDTYYTTSPYSADLQYNPIQAMKDGGERRYRDQYFTGNANLHIKNVVKGLTLDLNVSRRAGFYAYEGDYRFHAGMGRNGVLRGQYDINKPNRVIKTKNNSYQDKLEALLNYDLQTGSHHFHALAGASYEQYLKDEMTSEARNLLSNDLFSSNYYASDLATNSALSDAVQPWKMASLFGRLDYDFLGRYLLQATIRYDGSSRLAPGNRWGAFPSFSGAWRISEEQFFSNIRPYVNSLKLRASWGQLGNSTVLNSMYYPYIGMISNKTESSTTEVLSIMGNPIYYQKAMVSTGVTWETVQSSNIGIDFGVLNNRLNLSADYFWKKNDGMLAQLRIGNFAGVVQLPYQNAGVLKTQGWEVSVQWRDQIGDFSYNASVNIEDSQNELVSYAGNNVIKAGTVKLLEGHPLNTIWGYQTNGFWNSRDEYLAYKTANPGYETLEEDGKIAGGDVRYMAQGKADHRVGIGGGTPEEPGDLVCLGTTSGRYMFGINLGAQWKGFDFSMFWQGVGQRKFIIQDHALAPLGRSYEMPWTIHRDYWREDNKDAYFARIVENKTYNYKSADRWVQNGAYLRLKNIQLGYNIPLNVKFIEMLRVYVQGTDVLEFTDCLEVFDPETGNNPTNNDDRNREYYPFFRTWTLGVNLTF